MILFFFFSSRRRHTRLQGDWSSDVCSSDLVCAPLVDERRIHSVPGRARGLVYEHPLGAHHRVHERRLADVRPADDRHVHRRAWTRRRRRDLRNPGAQQLEQLADASAVLGGDRDWLAERGTIKVGEAGRLGRAVDLVDRKSTRLNSSHLVISYAVFCLTKKQNSSTLM